MALRTLLSHGANPARHFVSGRTKEPAQALEALLARMRQRLYPETLPVVASYWLKTICSSGHNRVWWGELNHRFGKLLRDESIDAAFRDILLSTRGWIERNVMAADQLPVGRGPLDPPFRSLDPERLIPYISRMFNEWLPADVAYLLTEEGESGAPDGGIPALAVAKALDRLLVRERLSPETLEMLLAPDVLSPKLVYPADAEIMRDVVLALVGRIGAPPPPILPAALLGVVAGSALAADYQDAVPAASLVQTPAGEELHVPITAAKALQILETDPVRIGSVVVTMDGRTWQSSALQSGDRNLVVYTPGERLRIDFTADHARLAVPWPEAPAQWFGAVPVRGPFELFGREWRTSSWEILRDQTLLHLSFSRTLPVAEVPLPAACGPRLRPASVDMAWSEVEHALANSLLRNSMEPVEEMRRAELIPLARALYVLADSVRGSWLLHRKQIETQLRAVRYHQAATDEVYGRPPWRILPVAVQANLAKTRLNPASVALLLEAFSEVPPAFTATLRRGPGQSPGHPSQAA